MNNLVKRSLSGIIYVVLIVFSILAGNLWFGLLTILFAVLASYEYTRMTEKDEKSGTLLPLLTDIIDMAAAVLLLVPMIIDAFDYAFILAVIPVYFVVRFALAVFDKRPHAFVDMAKSLLGVFYIGFGLLSALFLYNMGIAGVGKLIVLSMFILIWLNDTGAYCFGSTFGKHRLCERLSPKKSWEGFWGGMGCCVAYSVAAYFMFPDLNISLIGLILWSIVVSSAATIGDLFESMIKRTFGVKDSGNIIPGHGGILDRIDSLLYVAPVSCIYFLLYACFV